MTALFSWPYCQLTLSDYQKYKTVTPIVLDINVSDIHIRNLKYCILKIYLYKKCEIFRPEVPQLHLKLPFQELSCSKLKVHCMNI